jgi:hypothetical protein
MFIWYVDRVNYLYFWKVKCLFSIDFVNVGFVSHVGVCLFLLIIFFIIRVLWKVLSCFV